MKYFICGFSGAGKSFLLKRVKESNEYPNALFVDLDDYILVKYRDFKTLGDLIAAKGWDWFRAEERETLLNLLKSPDVWIALGGGTLTESLARQLKEREDVKGYWLDTDFDLCWKRIQNDRNRPLALQGREGMKALYNERLKTYKLFERLKPAV